LLKCSSDRASTSSSWQLSSLDSLSMQAEQQNHRRHKADEYVKYPGYSEEENILSSHS
ncbi:hypothetical protein WG66_011285, partial [Moniliophthora roreri]